MEEEKLIFTGDCTVLLQTLLYPRTGDRQFLSGAEADRVNDSGVIAEVKDDVTDSKGLLPYRRSTYKFVIGLPLTTKITAKSGTPLTIGFRSMIHEIKVRPVTLFCFGVRLQVS